MNTTRVFIERVSLSCYLCRVLSQPQVDIHATTNDRGQQARQNHEPFCDGSHQGSKFTPMAFVCDESKDYFLCQCKYSGNKPYCDGSHKEFDDDQVGNPRT
jgi:CDGSH-type Zn-finger protein